MAISRDARSDIFHNLPHDCRRDRAPTSENIVGFGATFIYSSDFLISIFFPDESTIPSTSIRTLDHVGTAIRVLSRVNRKRASILSHGRSVARDI